MKVLGCLIKVFMTATLAILILKIFFFNRMNNYILRILILAEKWLNIYA